MVLQEYGVSDSIICSTGTRKTAKLAMDQHEEKTNSSKVKSPVKRKSKFTNRSSRENDKKRKKFLVITLVKMKKNSYRKDDKKRKRNVG